MSLKTGALLALIAIGAVFVYQLSSRLSDQAVDVAVGVLCGIAASVPVSLGLLIALTRRRADEAEEYESEPVTYASPFAPQPPTAPRQPYPQANSFPPVIVISPPQNQFPNPYAPMLPPGVNMNEPPMTRDFKIIGDEDDDTLDA